MARCRKCGFKLPAEAAYCPNCGEPVHRAEEFYEAREVKELIRLSLLGMFISLVVDIYASAGNINLYFVPPFLSAIITIYLSRVKSLKDALIVATTIYLLTSAVEGGLSLGILYVQGEGSISL